ncbi:MAG: SpoIIE family protein phosphatase [Ruminiclostridium sp.]|nr:SpoIIE family protein phosphatase [Ruminiclostridium sp.]
MKNYNKVKFPLKLKSVLIIIVLSAVLCTVSILMSALRFSQTNEINFKNQASDLALTASFTVDGDAMKAVRDKIFEVLETIPEDEVVLSDDWGSDEFNAQLEKFSSITDMPEFKKIHEQLSKTQTAGISTLSSIYSLDYYFEHSRPYALYLVDAAEDDPCLPGVIDSAEEADWEHARKHEAMTPYITNYAEYGWLVSATAPVYDSNGEYVGVIAVDLDMNEIKANESSFIFSLAAVLVAITVAICIITLIIIDFAVIRPLNKLSDVAVGYINENEQRKKFSDVEMKRSDEIGNLSGAMVKMEKDIENYISDITSITGEKERISAELNIATKIQADMLPKDFPANDRVELFAAMTPAKEVGGDFYDFFFIDDDHLALVMADVSGKGVPAALFCVVAKAVLRDKAMLGGDPAKILYDVNNILCGNNGAGLFITVWLGILDLKTGIVTYCNAGHEYPVIGVRGRSVEVIQKDNYPPLAASEDMEFSVETLQLKNGDNLFLYTDGVPEAKSADGSRFGMDRLVKVLERTEGKSPEQIVTTLKNEVDAFQPENDPFDDVTIMSVVWKGRS